MFELILKIGFILKRLDLRLEMSSNKSSCY
jgi:hypothetical protein